MKWVVVLLANEFGSLGLLAIGEGHLLVAGVPEPSVEG